MADEYTARIEQLSDERRRVLELLRRRRSAEAMPAAVGVTRRPADRRLPLSVAQEQLWFLCELAPDQPTYNVVQASRLTGKLDREALRRALDRLVARHEALRVTFGTEEGRPYQLAHPPEPAVFAIDDLADPATGPLDKREEQALALLQDLEVHRPFDLRRAPGFRARLIRLDEQSHILSLAMHHIIGDGWSMGLVQSDLAELYRAERSGTPQELPQPGIQFGDYVIWQRGQLGGPWLEKQLAFWQQRLAALEPLDLPTDRPRPAVASFRGATVGYDFDPELWPAVRAYATQRAVSVNAVLVAAFNAVLARHSGQHDLATGSTLTGRARAELEPVVGDFANMCVIRLDYSGDPAFEDLVGRAADALLGAIEHQEAPFELVVERLAPPRDPGRNPLFQVAFQLLDARTWGAPQLAGLESEPVDLRLHRARFDLITSVIDLGGRCTSLTEYSTDLFDESRILRMLRHFERALSAGVREPRTRLSRLPITSENELKTVAEFARGSREPCDPATVHSLILRQAARTPDAVAIRHGERTVTYAELVGHAGRLAATLHEHGVRPGDLVGSLFEPSVDEIVAIAGTLSAGAVYMPLDPTAPPARVAGILERSGAATAIAKPELAGLLAAAPGTRVLPLEPGSPERSETAEPLNEPAEPLNEAAVATVPPDAPAYALHTSGSTGFPKAVVLRHSGFINYLAWMRQAWTLTPRDRVLHVCAPVFDLASGEILAPLTCGARVVVASRETILTPGALTELIRTEEVTHFFGTPTVLSLIDPAGLSSLREVMVAGEVCPAELLRKWRAPGRRLRNLYGPTETTVGCTVFDATEWDGEGAPPIGRPMPNRTVHILEPSGVPAPIGVPGEIVIGGEGVAIGYLGDPERTAEKFVTPVPGADDSQPPSGRVYFSGDLGSWTEDGQIRFLGRRDTQVKLRGLRVELGEIEGVLTRCPGVAKAAVAVRKDGSGTQQLVAYIVAQSDPVDTVAVRERLAEELPAALVPGIYVTLNDLPRTATDKVDRKALPEPVDSGLPQTARYVAPRTDAEREVAQAFSDILGIEQVGADDSFFDLGGHSLQAAHVLARLAKSTGTPIALKDFYAAPAVASVAKLVSVQTGGRRPSGGRSPLVSLKNTGSRPRLYCVHAVSGSPYWYLNLSTALHPDQPLDAFEAPGMEGEEPPIESLPRLAARYTAALLERQPDGPYLLTGWSLGGFLAFEMAQQMTAAGRRPALVAMIDSNAPGPLPRPSESEIAERFISDMAGVAGQPVPPVDVDLGALGAEQRLDYVKRLLVDAQFFPGDISAEFMVNRFAVFRANMLAMYAYQPRSYAGRIALLQADAEESRAAWRQFAQGGCDEVSLPGTHYTIWAPRNLPRLAGELEQLIAASLRDYRGDE